MFTNDHFIGIYKAQGRQIYGVYLPSLTTDIFWNSLTAAHFSGCMDLFPKFKFLRVDGTGFMHSQRLKEEVKEQLFMEDVVKLGCATLRVTGMPPGPSQCWEELELGREVGGGTASWGLRPALPVLKFPGHDSNNSSSNQVFQSQLPLGN